MHKFSVNFILLPVLKKEIGFTSTWSRSLISLTAMYVELRSLPTKPLKERHKSFEGDLKNRCIVSLGMFDSLKVPNANCKGKNVVASLIYCSTSMQVNSRLGRLHWSLF